MGKLGRIDSVRFTADAGEDGDEEQINEEMRATERMLADFRRREGLSPTAVVTKIEELLAGHPVSEQAVRWQREHWATEALSEFQDDLDAIANTCEQDGDSLLIRRRHVFALADGDVVRLFLAAMTWGYGTVGYGPYRVGDIVAHAGSDLRHRLEAQRAAAQLGPEQAWRSFRTHDRLHGFGPAFASKFAYFAAFERSEADQRPLIVDLNTSWAMWDLVELPRSFEQQDSYVQYVDAAHRWAQELGCRPDDVEWALFEIGKGVERKVADGGGGDSEE